MVSEQEKKKGVCSSCHFIDKIFFFGAKQCLQTKKDLEKNL